MLSIQTGPWNAWNNTQTFYLQALARAFMELVTVEANFRAVENAPPALQTVLGVTIDFFAA